MSSVMLFFYKMMRGLKMNNEKVYNMKLNKVYPLLVNKATKKGRTVEEVNQVVEWLTGYTPESIQFSLEQDITY